ncbi:CBS domain-containing protein [Spartinivicinus poritis]|uniref:CBS domain-containing protein n=1 Tax=Spartinivicinus poritis TaxID=2994640 RepID=A0ABT5U4K0_9GAMM|nr:CBS domain-containing protein [Spartinivicinus sp. A2-2]MDE1461289.1 CBS domain-containing protein [Spartinivicinus sp. A2-2]
MTSFNELPVVMKNEFKVNKAAVMTKRLRFESPAEEALLRFVQLEAHVMEAETNINTALLIMHNSHDCLKFVVNNDDEILGIVTTADLEGRKVLAIANKMDKQRQELTVKDIMVPIEYLGTLKYSDICHAKVGDLVKTLQQQGAQHLLVIAGDAMIGVVSSAYLSRVTDTALNIQEKAQNFSDIFNVVHNHQAL